ncbi:5-(carboxyamino)imidazole ribonucleotide synthase [Aliiglaciecola sp. CAU 1673]|uniref:5-(carboxyamino)imidazole ribonucleotide synthase n=1 Tax=Aliiglaciecola sp. CAU 1673 TaxID=3032595 RepID=UPI0023DC74CB|nr:5-(carboxyamino)imidazole ribonucleotide synthase [Aliiglaciecola sp. CAU 1673]MDF2177788.1 5-(carboxyamino)imidazole ribonucleotide synthase [Aliiglaciecola sp. CAU 1673]
MKVLILGSGQLARMMYLAAAPLGIHLTAVDVSNGKVVNPLTKRVLTQSLQDAMDDADAISVEFEHIPEPLLEQAQMTGKFYPSMTAILTGADRVREKRLLDKLNIANCPYAIVTDVAQLDDVMAKLGQELILKASRDGYDGYGQWRLRSADELAALKQSLAELDLQKVPLVVEKKLDFQRELSIVGMRGKNGDLAFYPLAENLHHQGQLHVSVAPAPALDDKLTAQAREVFTKLTEALDYVGVLAVEFFQMGDQLLVNEIAPRVHNSGHWTQQGADTSQFENHLRAICGLPLGSTQLLGVSAMINIIGYGSFNRDMLAVEGCHLHWYGKEVRPKRKMGHFNLRAKDYTQLAAAMTALSGYLPQSHFPMLADKAAELSTL